MGYRGLGAGQDCAVAVPLGAGFGPSSVKLIFGAGVFQTPRCRLSQHLSADAGLWSQNASSSGRFL